MSRPFRLAGSLLPFIFAALSFAFTIAAFVSRDWVHQEYFTHNLQPLDWRDPLFTLYRSPFILCDVDAAKPDANSSASYELHCTRFKPYGRGATACQTPNETDAYSRITGDWRMCQQVHFSGNLILAALVFVCIAFAMVMPLTFFFVRKAFVAADRDADTEIMEDEAAAGNGHHHRARNHLQKPTAIRSPLLVAATYGLLVSLAIVAMCSVLAQFYGVLGLVQSQPDNGNWASLSLGEVQNQQTGDLSHAPWVQGDALTIYASLGWFFSALAAGGIGASWLGRL